MTDVHKKNYSKQRMKEESKTAIMNAARDCYYEKGVENTTIDDIQARAKVARATIYRHFKSKEAIYANLLHLDLDETKNQVVAILAKTKTPTDFIAELILFALYEFPKKPIFKVCFGNPAAIVMSIEVAFTSDIIDSIMSEILMPCFQVAKKDNLLRQGVTLPLMIDWIKRMILSFTQSKADFQSDPKVLKKYIATFIISSMFKD